MGGSQSNLFKERYYSNGINHTRNGSLNWGGYIESLRNIRGDLSIWQLTDYKYTQYSYYLEEVR